MRVQHERTGRNNGADDSHALIIENKRMELARRHKRIEIVGLYQPPPALVERRRDPHV